MANVRTVFWLWLRVAWPVVILAVTGEPRAEKQTAATGRPDLLHLQPCPVTRYPQPVATELPGFFRCHCVVVSATSRLCKCVSEEVEDEFLILHGARIIERWPTVAYLGDTSRFELLQVSFSDRKHPMWVIVNHAIAGGGIGIEYWSISVFDSLTPGGELVLLQTEDYGEGSFVQVEGATGCQILVTEWLWDKEPGRGYGFYFTGRQYRVDGSVVEPVFDNGMVLSRRYLFRFRDERSGTVTEQTRGAPLAWLRDRTTRRTLDPYLSRSRFTDLVGTVTEVEINESHRPPDVVVSLVAEGRPARLRYHRIVGYADDRTTTFHRFGDEATGSLYPNHYLPSWIPDLVGTTVRFSRYEPAGRSGNVLWISRQ